MNNHCIQNVQSSFSDHTAESFLSNYARALLYCDFKKIVTKWFAVTDMTAVTIAVLLHSSHSESKGDGFHTNERLNVEAEDRSATNRK